MKQILIVEDDLAFGTMLQTWLKKKGFDVEKVTNVGAAARWLTEGGADSVNLILSDLRLPDHDGLFLLTWMRKRNIAVPFIVMTHYAEVQNAVLAMKSGAADYIAKPVQPDILLQKINDACKQRRLPHLFLRLCRQPLPLFQVIQVNHLILLFRPLQPMLPLQTLRPMPRPQCQNI